MRRISEQVWVSGQLDRRNIPDLAESGFSCLVNHRPDEEEAGQPTAAEIAQDAEAAGLSAIHIPVRGLPDAAQVAATRAVLDSLKAGDKALMFCRSGMRSAAAWAMAERSAGAEPDQLRAAAAAAGYDLSRLPL